MLFGTQEVKGNELYIGGVGVKKLAQDFGTPLYVYDTAYIRNRVNLFQTHFTSDKFEARVAYASKAFLAKRMATLMNEYGMSIDCVSGGELYTVKEAGYDMSKVLFHGNNKSIEELQMAIDYGVGLIVVDSLSEMKLLSNMAQKPVQALLRVNPGIEAHTHEYIVTAKLTSKFGESIFDEEIYKDLFEVLENSQVNLQGFHCHIGSQIFGTNPFVKTVDVMVDFMNTINTTYNQSLDVLNIGGGFGVYYTEEDTPVALKDLLDEVISFAEQKIQDTNLNLRQLIIEPGRSIVSNAGTSLYTIGHQKETYGKKDYLFVDGGMSDNIRPALYQAKYSADVATNMNGSKNRRMTIAGKLCESGDVLIEDCPIQDSQYGDILAIYTTGAYGYTMSSNYNRMLRPAVVFVEDKKASLVVKRETFADLLRNDL
jgi:diaminopimelate decarboxylase